MAQQTVTGPVPVLRVAPAGTCPEAVPTVGPVCGNARSTVRITDYGNGTCVSTARDPSRTPSLVDTGDCRGTFFKGAACGTFYGTINLRVTNPNNLPAGKYRPPNLQSYLNAIGLGNLSVAGVVSLRYEGPGTIPGQGQTPEFLPNLRYAFSYSVEDTTRSAVRQPAGLPGAAQLVQVQDLFAVQGTGMANLRSFKSLKCPPRLLRVTDNPSLSSLAGIEAIESSAGLEQVIVRNEGLVSREGLAPLGGALSCPTGAPGGPTSPATITSFSVKLAADLQEFTSPLDFCTFVATSPQDPAAVPQKGSAGFLAPGKMSSAGLGSDPWAGSSSNEAASDWQSSSLRNEQLSQEDLPSLMSDWDQGGSSRSAMAQRPDPLRCPLEVPVISPQCGTAETGIAMWDYGNGTCTMEVYNPGASPPDQLFPSCDTNVFGSAICGSFPGTLKLHVSNPWNLSQDSYLEPDFQRYLETVGIANVQSAGRVTFQVEGDSPIPVSLNPYFLPNLKYVEQYTVQDLTSPGQISSLPGAYRLKQVSGALTIIRTEMTDLTSLSGLTCPPQIAQIVGNPQLANLRGLERVGRSERLTQLTIDNPRLNNPAALSPLAGYLGCVQDSSSVDVATISVLASNCPRAFSPASAVCAYITGDGTCSLARGMARQLPASAFDMSLRGRR
eukprot:jgi/Botrbrau1/14481/Bobra.0014s0117.1